MGQTRLQDDIVVDKIARANRHTITIIASCATDIIIIEMIELLLHIDIFYYFLFFWGLFRI